jgi:hypothetical protein
MAAACISQSLRAGGKLWRWKYRFDGHEKLMSFGSYPNVPLSLARERHSQSRKLLATGRDPMAQRKAEKAAAENSFEVVSKSWLGHWKHGKSPRHADYVERRIESDILPASERGLSRRLRLRRSS